MVPDRSRSAWRIAMVDAIRQSTQVPFRRSRKDRLGGPSAPQGLCRVSRETMVHVLSRCGDSASPQRCRRAVASAVVGEGTNLVRWRGGSAGKPPPDKGLRGPSAKW